MPSVFHSSRAESTVSSTVSSTISSTVSWDVSTNSGDRVTVPPIEVLLPGVKLSAALT